jgi:hypothetical protein
MQTDASGSTAEETDPESLVYQILLENQLGRTLAVIPLADQLARVSRPFTKPARTAYSLAYHSRVMSLRKSIGVIGSWISSFDETSDPDAPDRLRICRDLIVEYGTELCSLSNAFIHEVTDRIMPNATDPEIIEENARYLKLQGDFYRYLAEFDKERRSDLIDKALESYGAAAAAIGEPSEPDPAKRRAEPDGPYPPADLLRGRIALGRALCLGDIGGETEKAREAAQAGLDSLSVPKEEKLRHCAPNEEIDLETVRRLLADNVTRWQGRPAPQ